MENKTDVYASLGDKRKKFMSWQTRTILVTMIGYAIFYFVRKNFSLGLRQNMAYPTRASAGYCLPARWFTAHRASSTAMSSTV